MSLTFRTEDLAAEGFVGFLTVGQLHRSGCFEVPDERGAYLLLRGSEAPHRILPRSQAPAWRGEDPTRPVEELTARWVEDTALLYAAAAPGSGVRHRLRQRVKRLLRFGHGSVVGHWGGRFVWQLAESSRLVVAWRPCSDDEDPHAIVNDLLGRFERTHGVRPFANPSNEAESNDD